MQPLSETVRSYVAAHSVRHHGSLPERFPDNLRANLRRRYRVSLTHDQALALAGHFRGMYAYGASALPRFLSSPRERPRRAGDVREGPFLAHLAARYPEEPQRVLECVSRYVVLYEYVK